MAEAAGSVPSCGTPAGTGQPPQRPLLLSARGRGSEPAGQDEEPAAGRLQPAAAPGSRVLCSQAVCAPCGSRPAPWPGVLGCLRLLARHSRGAAPAPGPGARGPLPPGLAVQRAPQRRVRGPARGALLHDETARSGVGGGTGRSFCRRPSGHGHVQPAGSQVRASGASRRPAGTAALPQKGCWVRGAGIGKPPAAFPGSALSPGSARARSGPSRRW